MDSDLYRVLEARRGILAPWLIPGNVVVEYLDARYLSEPGVNVAFVSSGLTWFKPTHYIFPVSTMSL